MEGGGDRLVHICLPKHHNFETTFKVGIINFFFFQLFYLKVASSSAQHNGKGSELELEPLVSLLLLLFVKVYIEFVTVLLGLPWWLRE